ncbi:hypothetical protein [Dyadobacter aurulentus]|uniref:hypothetical protein n=1 Tax=Dyadobacter sp. UC 10 TaxID=2605428 RepID=UPI0011F38F33|nr:hypothetical protein [Dyadobacter sp. UC 10]KAA0991683.1 hypothetical protein FXO21_16645 [Dyadobacter sp. UC 10]
MKAYGTSIILTLLLISCATTEDREHLIFIDKIDQIEVNMLTVDSIIPLLPPQNDASKIQSYFYKVLDKDTILYINFQKIGSISKPSTHGKVDSILNDKSKSAKFIAASRILARNNLTHCLNDFCGWVYVYKFSNDRGAYRPVIYSDTLKQQLMVDSCGFTIIDKKGNIVLLKEK